MKIYESISFHAVLGLQVEEAQKRLNKWEDSKAPVQWAQERNKPSVLPNQERETWEIDEIHPDADSEIDARL